MRRWDLQKMFANLNPDFNETTVEIAPDGDVQLTEDQIKGFQVNFNFPLYETYFECSCL